MTCRNVYFIMYFFCLRSFKFSWVDKVTTQTESLVSFIWKLGFWSATVPATRIQFSDHFNWRLILQLIKDISSVLQKLLRCFNGTVISTSYLPQFPICPVFCCLNLNEPLLLSLVGESIIPPLLFRACSSL